MAVLHDQQLIQQKPFEAPPEYSTDLPDLSVLGLDSPCQYGSSGDGNSHKRPSLTSINSQQPKPKKLLTTLLPPPLLILSSAAASPTPSTFLFQFKPLLSPLRLWPRPRAFRRTPHPRSR
ncbi:hypothetical protein L484_002497 [Morus notabilis]|uniref:Uncharacterized protein n=1 Tax=Morus notabilis TaxID=981085 RepID=W9R3P3_9ROSA|nr:hypothetical protein L484_002497 [Morus notabilis]